MSKIVGRNHTSTLPRMQGSLLPCLPPIILHPRRELDPKCAPPPLLSSPPSPPPCIPQHHGGGGQADKKEVMGPARGFKCTPHPRWHCRRYTRPALHLDCRGAPGVFCRLLEGGSANGRHRSRVPTLSPSSCGSEGQLAPSCPAGLAQGTFCQVLPRGEPEPQQCRAAPVQAQGGASCARPGPLTDRDAEESDEEVMHCSRLALPSHPDAERPLVPASGGPVAGQDGLYLHSENFQNK